MRRGAGPIPRTSPASSSAHDLEHPRILRHDVPDARRGGPRRRAASVAERRSATSRSDGTPSSTAACSHDGAARGVLAVDETVRSAGVDHEQLEALGREVERDVLDLEANGCRAAAGARPGACVEANWSMTPQGMPTKSFSALLREQGDVARRQVGAGQRAAGRRRSAHSSAAEDDRPAPRGHRRRRRAGRRRARRRRRPASAQAVPATYAAQPSTDARGRACRGRPRRARAGGLQRTRCAGRGRRGAQRATRVSSGRASGSTKPSL